jgi:rhomboid-like protein
MNQKSFSTSGGTPIAVFVLLLLNGLIFLSWNFSTSITPELSFMTDNFLVNWTGLAQKRYWILITSVFSHISFWHFFMNMFVLNSFGPIVEKTLGTFRFIKFYLIAGVISSFCHAAVSAFLLRQPDLQALGASGAISGMIFLFSFLYPKQKILLFGLIPLPALWGALLFAGLDVWGLFAQAEGGGLPIGHGAHLGGAMTGLIYYYLFLHRTRER